MTQRLRCPTCAVPVTAIVQTLNKPPAVEPCFHEVTVIEGQGGIELRRGWQAVMAAKRYQAHRSPRHR